MPETTWTCPGCDRAVAGDLSDCPECHSPRPFPEGEPAGERAATPPTGAASAQTLSARLEKLEASADAASAFGVILPRFPPWAQEVVARTGYPEVWEPAIHKLERDARSEVASACDRFREGLNPRLLRLEAYSVDCRLERDRIEEGLAEIRSGELAAAITVLQQVDRLVALKEHYLDQARDDLEKTLGLLRDLEAIGLAPEGMTTAALAGELEPMLRQGETAALKQRLRALRSSGVARFRRAAPEVVYRIGERLLLEKDGGLSVRTDVEALALGARALAIGEPEDGAHILRRLASARGVRLAEPAP